MPGDYRQIDHLEVGPVTFQSTTDSVLASHYLLADGFSHSYSESCLANEGMKTRKRSDDSLDVRSLFTKRGTNSEITIGMCGPYLKTIGCQMCGPILE